MDGCCSICTENFRRPKGLPCFHTFCQECLQMYIEKYSEDKSFNCPSCRRKTEPTDPEKPKSEWAKGFPTNNYISKLQAELCPSHHNETMDINCNTCSVMICCQCCLSTHESCEKIVTEINAEKIKKSLLHHQDKLKAKLKFMEENLCKLQGRDTIVSQIKNICQELKDFVKNQRKCHLQIINDSYSNESDCLQEKKDNIVHIMNNLNENIDHLNNLIGKDTTKDKPLNQFTLDYEPKHILAEKISYLLETKEKSIDFQINQNFIKLSKDLLKVNMVEKFEKPEPTFITPAKEDVDENVPHENVYEEAMEPDAVNQKQSLLLTLIDTIPLVGKSIGSVNDMVMLNDQYFLLTDACYRMILKFSISGNYLESTSFDKEPFSLCLLQNNCVAVSIPHNKKILILDCANLKIIIDTLSFQKSYSGLGSDNKKRIFSLYRNENLCIDIISKSNPKSSYTISHVIKLPFPSSSSHRFRVLPSGHVLIPISSSSVKLCCVNQNGEKIFLYEGNDVDTLRYILDIAVSTHFIYFAEKTTDYIYRINHQGNFVDIPMVGIDGISQPKKIYVNDGGVLAIFSKKNSSYQIQLFSS